MIELGACVVGDMDNSFSGCLLEDPNTSWNPETRQWWLSTEHNRRVLSEIQQEAQPIATVIYNFKDWVSQFKRPVIVAFPTSFDFPFLHYYWWKWIKSRPKFSHGALDIKTYAMCTFKSGYKDATKRQLQKKFPSGFDRKLQHTHRALDDAKEQAFLFRKLQEARNLV
jgi:DNA polymerase III alpha subunit (gram-positive type)